MKYNVLIVDDEENILSSLELAMEKHYKVFCASDGKTALDIFRKQNIHIVFLDLTLDDTDGLSVLKEMKSINSYAEIVIITATNDIPTAVFATKLGAYDYITKPYEISRLLLLAKKITEKIELENEVAILRSIKSEESGKDIFIAKSKALKEIKKLINKVSLNKSTILITGKSGTGKEVIAREIHFSGNDKKKPFVPVHTGALSDGIIESELFGHEKGS
ncbi:MAG: sigma-54-dependent Fis family transcriptional regulator, partial [Candidatus Aureabacteria bacterium]|nr:sigma-54-dependent Fis family transcriptional regulator [Candidatus Auribacterota bacterium]